jgi:hypothetical protein
MLSALILITDMFIIINILYHIFKYIISIFQNKNYNYFLDKYNIYINIKKCILNDSTILNEQLYNTKNKIFFVLYIDKKCIIFFL